MLRSQALEHGLNSAAHGLSSWRRKRQPTLVFFPGKTHGQKSLVGCGLWGPKESDPAEHQHMCGLNRSMHVGSSHIRDQTHVSCTGKSIAYHEHQGSPGAIFFYRKHEIASRSFRRKI